MDSSLPRHMCMHVVLLGGGFCKERFMCLTAEMQ